MTRRGNVGTTDSQAITIDTAAPAATVRSPRLPRHRHVVERLHHQRHLADGVGHATARLAPARRCRSAATAAPAGTMLRRPARPGAMTTPHPHGRASPIRRGWSTRPAMSGHTDSQAITIDTAAPAGATAITAIAADTGTARRLHHQRHHADGVGQQRRAGCRREGAGQQRRRRQLARLMTQTGTQLEL